LFGIRPLWSFTKDGISITIGPDYTWHMNAREHRLLTDEALRVLKSEQTLDGLTEALLSVIPEADGLLYTSESPHVWLNGRHSSAQWAYHIRNVFGVLDAVPAPKPTSPSANPKRGRKRRYNPDADRQFYEDWQRAKGVGITFKDFCTDRDIKVRDGGKTLTRIRAKKTRAQ
jgi:hypothetical protein